VLDRVDPGNWNTVFEALAASPRWRVCEWDHAIVAFERTERDGVWTVPRDGWHRGDVVWRALLRFTAWDEGLPWGDSALVTRVEATEETVRVVPFAGSGAWEGWTIEATAFEGRDLSLETGVAYRSASERTEEIADGVGEMVTDILAGHRGAGLRARPSLQIQTSPMGLEIQGWLDPGGPGWTWIRLVADGEPWEEDAVRTATREAIGWSADPEQVFWLQGEVPVPAGPGFDAIAEVWLQPPLSEPTKVAELPVHVPAR
jgi:hypothetical protein